MTATSTKSTTPVWEAAVAKWESERKIILGSLPRPGKQAS
jgi:hypothetical protein